MISTRFILPHVLALLGPVTAMQYRSDRIMLRHPFDDWDLWVAHNSLIEVYSSDATTVDNLSSGNAMYEHT